MRIKQAERSICSMKATDLYLTCCATATPCPKCKVHASVWLAGFAGLVTNTSNLDVTQDRRSTWHPDRCRSGCKLCIVHHVSELCLSSAVILLASYRRQSLLLELLRSTSREQIGVEGQRTKLDTIRSHPCNGLTRTSTALARR